MKKVLSPYEAMQAMVNLVRVDKSVASCVLSFDFTDIGLRCFVQIAAEGCVLSEGVPDRADAYLVCSFTNWLKLSSGRLNPVVGVVTSKLKFKGNAKLFELLKPSFQKSIPIEMPQVSNACVAPKTIVVLSASPRKKSGYTALLTQALVEGLQSVSDVSVTCVDLSDYEIKTCTGCWFCWQRNGGDCIFKEKDDHAKLAKLLDAADMVVYAFPLYADGMPSELKRYFDRHVSSLYPYMMKGKDSICHPVRRMREDQSLAILSLCGFPEVSHFDAVKAHFRALAHNDHRRVAAELVRPAVMYLFNNPTLLDLQQIVLDDLKEAGRQLAQNGVVSEVLSKRIAAPVCKPDEFIRFANNYWQDRIDNQGGRDY